MFVKIKELPEKIKKKALKRMKDQRGIEDSDIVLAAAYIRIFLRYVRKRCFCNNRS